MPIKYADPATGKFIRANLAKTGAPSAMGIKTIADLVRTSLGRNAEPHNIFFKARL
jgi:hypothetical protein